MQRDFIKRVVTQLINLQKILSTETHCRYTENKTKKSEQYKAFKELLTNFLKIIIQMQWEKQKE